MKHLMSPTKRNLMKTGSSTVAALTTFSIGQMSFIYIYVHIYKYVCIYNIVYTYEFST